MPSGSTITLSCDSWTTDPQQTGGVIGTPCFGLSISGPAFFTGNGPNIVSNNFFSAESSTLLGTRGVLTFFSRAGGGGIISGACAAASNRAVDMGTGPNIVLHMSAALRFEFVALVLDVKRRNFEP
jgi:hypothetical protein